MIIIFELEAHIFEMSYGDFGERFYNSLESAAEKFLDYAKMHPDFFSLHEAEFENLDFISRHKSNPLFQGPFSQSRESDLQYMQSCTLASDLLPALGVPYRTYFISLSFYFFAIVLFWTL